MKTRIIQTDFYRKMVKVNAPMEARFLYKYLLDNEYIGMTGIYELPDIYMTTETALTPKQLKSAKQWLSDKKKIFFYDGWVCVKKAEFYNNYKNGEKNKVAYKKERASIPSKVLMEIDKFLDSTIDTTIEVLSDTSDSNHKSETINQKPELGVVKGIGYLQNLPLQDFEDIDISERQLKLEAEKAYNWLKCNGKVKKDYKAYMRNWLFKNYKKRVLAKTEEKVEEPAMSDEQRKANIERINAIRGRLDVKSMPKVI